MYNFSKFLIKFIGFIVLIFGTLTYNKIINVIQDSPEPIVINTPDFIVKKIDEEENLLSQENHKGSTELSSNS